MLYSVWMRASSVSSAPGSVIANRVGQSPFRWLKNDSTCAWSVGVPAAVMLGDRHQRHELAGVDRGHLGAVVRPRDQDRTVLVTLGREPVGAEQPLVLERAGEQQLHLGVGLLAREQVADPVAGDDVDDRVRDPLGAGEVRRVPNPDTVLFPGNLGKRRLRRSWAEPLAQQSDPVLERDSEQRGGRDEHRVGVAAAVRELAMRAVDRTPLLDQIEDRLLLPGQQPVTAPPPGRPSSSVPVSRSR